MKKRIFVIAFCLTVMFTAMSYMGFDNPVVSTAAAISGNQSATTISKNTTWTLDGDMTLNGTITVKSGATLKIYNNNATERTIKRSSSFTGDMFYVEEGGTLHINGDGDGSGGCFGSWDIGAIVVDGNANVTATGQIIDCSGKLSLRDTVIRNNRGYNAIWLGGSGAGTATDQHHYTTVEITRTMIQNCSAVSAGGIMIADSTPADYTVEIWDSLIQQCTAVDGSAIYFHGGGQAYVLLKESVIDDCDQFDTYIENSSGYYGGALRTNGNGRFKFEMRDSILRNCDSWKFGGGIYWNASGPGSELIVNDCQFLNNSAAEMGGGMFLEGSNMTITATTGNPSEAYTTGFPGGNLVGTLIQGNNAPNGGGISYKCYSNSEEVQVPTTVANFNENVIFKNNTGANGPALAYNLHDTHNYPTGATFTFNINGAEFTNNTGTGYGGAIYVRKCRTDYVLEVNFNSGTIANNIATNGGAIAIVTDSGVTKGGTFNMKGGTLSNNTATADGGALYVQKGNFNLSGGTVSSNKAKNGGAACLTDGSFKMTDGMIQSNEASANGGAIYVTGGDFEISKGEIKANKASANGGAAYVTGGTFTMKGGTLSNNEASANGGAAYVAGTDSVKGNFTVKHGILTENKAINGGAAYVNGGDFTIESGTMSKNTALYTSAEAAEDGTEGYGGAVYANGGNIYIGLVDCELAKPKDAHKTGQPTYHPVITENAAAFGGGLAVNNGQVHIYCSDFENNTAASDGTGQNVFMSGEGGEIHHYIDGAVIGEMEDHGMVSIGGKLYIYQDGEFVSVTIKYHSNFSVDMIWEGDAPDGYYLNLPYCPKNWSDTQAQENLAFAGWAETAEGTTPTEIRAKDDYNAIGDPIMITDTPPGEPVEINFYALWVPLVNNIHYAYSLDGETILHDDQSLFTDYAKTYRYQNMPYTIDGYETDPTRAGYSFVGWMMYSDIDKVSNWDADAKKYNEGTKKVTDIDDLIDPMPWDPMGSFAQNFGDITLVAVFEPQYADLVIEKSGAILSMDPDATFVFTITGDPYDEALDNFTMDTVVVGNDSVTIEDLPVGDYTVTEITDWSWRYNMDSVTVTNAAGTYTEDSTAFALNDPDKIVNVKFENIRTNSYWLAGNHYTDNWWGGGLLDNRVIERANN